MSKSAQQRHPRNLVSKAYPTWFAEAIRVLDRHATRAEVATWLDNRVTLAQVKNWRVGLAKPPQWVVDRMGELLRQQSLRAAETASAGVAGPGMNHGGGTIALHNYRRQRALEKEKVPD